MLTEQKRKNCTRSKHYGYTPFPNTIQFPTLWGITSRGINAPLRGQVFTLTEREKLLRTRVQKTNGEWRIDFMDSSLSGEVTKDLPLYLKDKVYVLMLVDDGTDLAGIGYRVSDNVFYVEE